MTYKIITLAIEALVKLGSSKGNSGQFNRDVDEAIKALRKIKKYL